MKSVPLLIVLVAAGGPGFAGITYSCAPSVPTTVVSTTNVTTNLCSDLNGSSVAGVYGGIFSNANASIYIQFAGSGLAGSDFNLNSVSYSSYLNALATHEGDANDVIAVNSLSATEPGLYSGDDMAITSALGAALGLADTAGIDANGNNCTMGNSGCYNGVITIGASASPIFYPLSPGDPAGASGWDFFMLVEHETDEILGTISCIGSTDNGGGRVPVNQCTDTNGNAFISPADLFRYSAANTLSFLNNATGGTAYFSIDGGNTVIANYNNTANGDDYGDWLIGGPCLVQSASACQGANLDIATDGGPEIAVLDAVGFNTVPEPGSLGLLGASLAILAFAAVKARR